jgi:hypothetical protein
LSQLLVDEGPPIISLAKECVLHTSRNSADDDAVLAKVRNFALHLAETPAL